LGVRAARGRRGGLGRRRAGRWPSRDCVSQTGGSATWQDLGCNDVLPFVCEKEPWLLRLADNHAYQIVTTQADPRAWQDAQNACLARTAHLATVTSAEEQALLLPVLRSLTWLGAHDMGTEGSFEWATGEPFGYAAWGGGEPDDGPGGGGADCLAVGPSGAWEDDACNGGASYLCEVD